MSVIFGAARRTDGKKSIVTTESKISKKYDRLSFHRAPSLTFYGVSCELVGTGQDRDGFLSVNEYGFVTFKHNFYLMDILKFTEEYLLRQRVLYDLLYRSPHGSCTIGRLIVVLYKPFLHFLRNLNDKLLLFNQHPVRLFYEQINDGQ